jgi:hypothetical protein
MFTDSSPRQWMLRRYEIAPGSGADKASRCRFLRNALNWCPWLSWERGRLARTDEDAGETPARLGRAGDNSRVAIMMGDAV